MSKLYPPDIGGVIPAFYGEQITVPFTMNKLTAGAEIGGFALIIKSIANSKILCTLKTSTATWVKKTNKVTFNLPKGKNVFTPIVGQYYKVQMCYLDKDETYGFWSNVATVKYTQQPAVSIEGLEPVGANANPGIFVGYYNSEADRTEKVYTYRFDVYDYQGNLYETSGVCLHNGVNDVSGYESHDTYTLKKSLDLNLDYKVQYTVTTTNKLEIPSEQYIITEKETIDPELKARVIAELNPENGYILVRLAGEIIDGIEPAAIGRFRLKRSCSKDNYGVWQTVYEFKLNGQLPSAWSWKDMTIEHGYHYQYGLEQYSDTLVSNKILSNEVYAEFEDAFLFDGTRQLKIKFNPKISSFKSTVLESKQDTMGSKYPFFFRNGRVGYKEFPISGLISYHCDEEELFLTNEDMLLDDMIVDPRTVDLTTNNIAAERIFKMAVLEWLNDGSLKLFRSPTEGNFIVRLLNVSLSPTDTLGRMLHTFSATAYEAKEFTYEAIVNLGFLSLGDIAEQYTTRWKTIDLTTIAQPDKSGYSILNDPTLQLTSLRIEDAIPGTQLALSIDGYTDKNGQPIDSVIEIGITGTYKIDLADALIINDIKVNSYGPLEGTLTYSYESSVQNTFDTIEEIKINDWWFAQYIGEHDDVIALMEERVTVEDSEAADARKGGSGEYLIDKAFQGLRKTLSGLKYLRFWKREVYNLYKVDSSYYWESIPNAEKVVAKDKRDYIYTDKVIGKSKIELDTLATFSVYNVLTDKYFYYDADDRRILKRDEAIPANKRLLTLYTTSTSLESDNYKKYYENRDCRDNSLIVDISRLTGGSYEIDFRARYRNTLFKVYIVEYLDGKTQDRVLYSNECVINKNTRIDLSETGWLELPTNYEIQQLQLSSGIVFECAYQTKEIIYSLERKDTAIKNQKQTYETYLRWYQERLLWQDDPFGDTDNVIAAPNYADAKLPEDKDTNPDGWLPKEGTPVLIPGSTTQYDREWSIESYYQAMIKERNAFLILLHKAVQRLKEETGYYV